MADQPTPRAATISRVERLQPHGSGWQASVYDPTSVVAYSDADFLEWIRAEGAGLYVMQYTDHTSRLYLVRGSEVSRVRNDEGQLVIEPEAS